MMADRGVRTALVCGASILALALPNGANAQTTGAGASAQAPTISDAEGDTLGQGDIVVTAQKREQRLLDVPLAIQAISGADLEAAGDTQLNDVVKEIPGAASVSRSGPGYETISIRGISSGTTGDATVGYYIDDVPFGVPNLQLAPPSRLFDLQRVEVLRGPQGTLYGQGAMGGTIRLVTAQPDLERIAVRGQLEGSMTEGGDPSYAGDAVLNVPLTRGVAALRFSGGYQNIGGFADSPALGRKNINDGRSWNLRGKLLLKPSDRFDITLSGWRVENEQDFRNTFDTADPAVINTTGPASRPNFINNSLTLASLVMNLETGAGRLTSSSAYTDYNLNFDASYLAGGILRNISDFDVHSLTQEIRLTSSGSGPLNYVIGGYYNESTIRNDICLSLIVPTCSLFSININSASAITTRSWAAFGELSYGAFDDRLTATFGGRYFEDRRSVNGRDRNTSAPRAQSGKFTTFNPRFNLAFRATDRILLYTNVAKGFRSGSFQTPSQVASAVAQGIPATEAIEPDHVWSYEAGLKGRILGDLLTIDASAYQIDWKNIQLQFTVTGVAALANGGDGRSRGIDLGVTLRPVRGLVLQAVGNVNESEYTRVIPAITKYNALAAPGGRIPNVPKSSLAASASYTFALSPDLSANLTGDYVYRGKSSDTSGLISQDLNEFGLRAGLQGRAWRFQVFAQNIENTHSVVVRNTLGVQTNYPRQIGARLSFNY